MAQSKERGGRGGKPAITSVSEWISAGLGLLLTFAIFGTLGWQAVSGSSGTPPMLEAKIQQVVRSGANFVVEVEVSNRADRTAAAVLIEGELKQGGSSVEKSQATITYVPAHSARQAGLIFTHDPRGYQLEVRPIGYQLP